MIALLKAPWRWLFPRLQRWLPARHGQLALAAIDRASTVFHELYENGNYDPASNGEGWLLRRLASSSPKIIFDVGANQGDYSRLALSACPQAHVYAFEPIPAVFNRLLASLAQETRAGLFSLALADQNGPLSFDFDPTNTGITSAVQGVHALVHCLKGMQSITAPGCCLDDFCAEHGIDGIDLLKIDVEGFEANVLKGGAKMIVNSKIACIQLEYGKANLFSRVFIHDYMREYGEAFAIGKLYPNGVRWFECYDASFDDLLGPNLVMVARKQPHLIELLTLTPGNHR